MIYAYKLQIQSGLFTPTLKKQSCLLKYNCKNRGNRLLVCSAEQPKHFGLKVLEENIQIPNLPSIDTPDLTSVTKSLQDQVISIQPQISAQFNSSPLGGVSSLVHSLKSTAARQITDALPDEISRQQLAPHWGSSAISDSFNYIVDLGQQSLHEIIVEIAGKLDSLAS